MNSIELVEIAWNNEYEEYLKSEFDDFSEYIFNKYPLPKD